MIEIIKVRKDLREEENEAVGKGLGLWNPGSEKREEFNKRSGSVTEGFGEKGYKDWSIQNQNTQNLGLSVGSHQPTLILSSPDTKWI